MPPKRQAAPEPQPQPPLGPAAVEAAIPTALPESSTDAIDDAPSHTGDALDQPRSAKRLQTSSDSALAALPRSILDRHLDHQRNRCLSILSGRLPPAPPPTAQPDDQRPPGFECIGHTEEWQDLYTTLNASVTASEGNSCLLIGASGAGKTMLLESVLRRIEREADAKASTAAATATPASPFFRVHLAGSIQTTDRIAMKEMAQQLISQGAFREEDVSQEMGNQLDGLDDDGQGGNDQVFGGDDDDYDIEAAEEAQAMASAILSSLSNIISHIISLLSTTSSSSHTSRRKPLVITLDDFDLFTARPRQALLYCLLDAVQAGSYGFGLAVIGLTSRVDTTDLLEKRVKSRFSHRIIHVRPPASLEAFSKVAQVALSSGGHDGTSPPSIEAIGADATTSDELDADAARFHEAWSKDVSTLVSHPNYVDLLRGLYDFSNDIRLLYRTLFPPLSALTPSHPRLDVDTFLEAASEAVGDVMSSTLPTLTDPELSLLVAAKHLQVRDRRVFNFEMCLDEIRRFVARESRSKRNVTIGGGGVGGGGGGAVNLADRRIALLAFQTLLSCEIFLVDSTVTSLEIKTGAGGGGGGGVKQEFVKVRCILDPAEIVKVVKMREKSSGAGSGLGKWCISTV